jgi:2-oxoglutarate ferredoxin oxidoreductase subunit beta
MSAPYVPPPGVEAEKVDAARDEVMTGLHSTWCPGCGHGTLTQLLADCIGELGLRDRIVLSVGVGCGGSLPAQLDVHCVLTPHGRASDTATGIARMLPDRIVVQYSGDGDACGIGLAGLMHACNRAENFLVFIYNNNVYGMTGGQMGPTTTKEVPTTTFQGGRDESVMGYPIDIVKTLAHFPGVAYAARCALTSGPRYVEARKVVRRAFEIHESGVRGMKVIDALGNCNVNWKGGGVTFTPETANDFIEQTIMPYFEMGELRLPPGLRPVRVNSRPGK